MNRETDTVFLQTVGKFISAQVQLATAPLLQKIESLEKEIVTVRNIQNVEVTALRDDAINTAKELDGAIEGFAAEIARVEKLIPDQSMIGDVIANSVETEIKKFSVVDGKDGIDGKDGKDVDWDIINDQLSGGVQMIREEIKKFFDEIPKPKEGAPGMPGEPGVDGKDADMDSLFAYIENYMKAIPVPQNGKDGANGKDGSDGKDGPAGRDGADVVAAFRDSDRHVILTLSNGVAKDIGSFDGKDGKDGAQGEPGKDGKDGAPGINGLGIKDLSINYDGRRTFTFKHICEDGSFEEKSFRIPAMMYADIWREGNSYQKGDVVTKGGSGFVALEDTDSVPETVGCKWKLFIKRGDPGKRGDKGEPGDSGKHGRDGRDLTQMGFDGKKW